MNATNINVQILQDMIQALSRLDTDAQRQAVEYVKRQIPASSEPDKAEVNTFFAFTKEEYDAFMAMQAESDRVSLDV